MNWNSIASLATAAGTLVLAIATFASVRSANRAARTAERSLLVGLRPLLMPSRLQDDPQKVMFFDRKWVHLPGGGAAAEVENSVVYLAASVRNAGPGIAVLHGWRFHPDYHTEPLGDLSEFRRLTRDLYVPPGGAGFWQGAFRDEADPQHAAACEAVAARQPVTVDLLYGDHEGGQRAVTRLVFQPRPDADDGWLVSASRHWNIDRPNPR